MNRIKLYLLVVTLSLSFFMIGNVSCHEKEAVKGHRMKNIVIGQNDAGEIINTLQGGLIHIRLEENPSTGYQWEIAFSDDQVLSMQKSEFIGAQHDTLGSGGTRAFQLKADTLGYVNISLIHKKPWESDDSAIEQFEVTIKVEAE